MLLAARSEWLPASTPDGVVAQVISDPVAQVRVAAGTGAKSVMLVVDGLTVSGAGLVVSDHVNLTGANPLVGPNVESFGVRFPDMTEPYPLRSRLAGLGPEGVVADIPTTPVSGDLPDAQAVGAESVTSGLAAAVIAANHCGLKVGAAVIPPGVDGRVTIEHALSLLAG